MRSVPAGQRGGLDQRVGGDRDVAGVRRARLDAVGVAQHEVGVAPPPDAQPRAVGRDQRARRAGGDGAMFSKAPGASTSPAIRDSAANWSAPETMVFCIAQTGGALESRARSILPRIWLSP